jgi:methionyl-tRNA formyltransferase
MRVCILTTETPHHTYFTKALAADGHDVLALVEERVSVPRYEIAHPFEAERDNFERAEWFSGREARIRDFAEARTFTDINLPACLDSLTDFAPDLTVTFGTGRLRAEMIARGGDRLVNLHGGDPEHYRGLDTHLWAVWHKDFGSLATCLHRVAEGLDTGDVFACLPVEVAPGSGLHQLRKANTETCLQLTRMAVCQLQAEGHLTTRPQRQVGRYYSFMPSALKAVCVQQFSRFTARLP